VISPGEGTFHGTVRRVTFEKDETGYRVVRVEITGAGLETVVGVMPRVAPDTDVRIVGKRVNDPRFGPQIQAESVTVMSPTTRQGVERFLASGIVKGVGPALAKRIVEAFGEDTLRVLDEGGARLTEVRGIGKATATAAGEAWALQRSASAALVFLAGHGVPPGLSHRILRKYGAKTALIVEREPYRLAAEVPGVGFLTADRLAAAVGIGRDAPERLEAGVVHALNVVTEAGHTWTSRRELATRAATLLEVDESLTTTAIDRVAIAGPVVVEGGGDEARVFPSGLRDAERAIASRLSALLGDRGELTRADEAMAAFERATKVTLAPAQRTAIEAAAARRVLVVTGGPGVGKTTIVRALLSLFDRAKLSTRLAAPTGRAAKRMSESTGREAVTLHRLLEVDARTGRFSRGREDPIVADAVIVDEASMIDVGLARALVDALKDGTRLVLVGDVDQLPSVGPGAVLRDVLASGVVPSVRLTTIFRQAGGSLIVEAAHRIREGAPPPSSPEPSGDFFVVPRRDPDAARETIVELVTKRIPARFGLDPLRDIQVLTPMHKGAVGVEALNEALQTALNPGPGAEVARGARRFRMGDKVMQLKNDYDRDVYNGDVGLIRAVDTADRELTVRVDERDVAYDDDSLDALSLAYAVSIHKSQGSEYPAVVIPWLRQHYVMLARNLLYTAVTRGKRLVVLVADPTAIDVALREDRRNDRRTSLADRLREA
jgi:exodeoxyribonuclease V alpha subunit